MGEEQVEGADDVLLDGVDPLDVVEGDLDLFRPEHDVGRAACTDRRAEQHAHHREQEQRGHDHERVERREPPRADVHRVAAEQAPPQPRHQQGQNEREPAEGELPAPLAGSADVGVGGDQAPYPRIRQQ